MSTQLELQQAHSQLRKAWQDRKETNEKVLEEYEKLQGLTDDDEKTTSQEEINNLKGEVNRLDGEISTLEAGINELMVKREPSGTKDQQNSSNNADTQQSNRNVKINLQGYKEGGDFGIFCRRFVDQCRLQNIKTGELSTMFLSLVDEKTYKSLMSVADSLSVTERANADLFTKRFEEILVPKVGGPLMKRRLKEIRRRDRESVSEFIYRVRSMAMDAYGPNRTQEREEACLEALIDGVEGLKDKVYEMNVQSFAEAEKMAIRSENLQKEETEPDDLIHINATRKEKEDRREGSRNKDNRRGYEEREGEWICPSGSCRFNNYQFRRECLKCRTPKNEEGRNMRREQDTMRSYTSNNRQRNTNREDLFQCYRCGRKNHTSRNCGHTTHVDGRNLNYNGVETENQDTTLGPR